MNNGQAFHIGAILYRFGKIVAMGVNGICHKNSYKRYYNGSNTQLRVSPLQTEASCAHAEMIVLEHAQEGDHLEVMRWKKDGSLAMAKPCRFCQKRINRLKIKVRYTNEFGEWQSD